MAAFEIVPALPVVTTAEHEAMIDRARQAQIAALRAAYYGTDNGK